MKFKEIQNKKDIYMSVSKYRNIRHSMTSEELEFYYAYLYNEFYLNQELSLAKIAKLVGISNKVIIKAFKKRSFKVINKQNLLRVRENLFEKIETEEDAYWLGFIYADGYISDGGTVEISLKHTDYKHLLKFADYCEFDKSKVRKKDKTNFPNSFRCRMSFATQHLKQRFFDLGVIPRKSLILTYPDFLNNDLHRHFIRGYFDGDGSVGIYKHKKVSNKILGASLLGTLPFLKKVVEVIPVHFPNIYNKYKNTQLICASRHEAKEWIIWMYEDSTIYLDRKYSIYLEILEFYK